MGLKEHIKNALLDVELEVYLTDEDMDNLVESLSDFMAEFLTILLAEGYNKARADLGEEPYTLAEIAERL